MFDTTFSTEFQPIEFTRNAEEPSTPFLVTAQRIWDFVLACIIKEFSSNVINLMYRVAYIFKPHWYNLNPVSVKAAAVANQNAKVIMLLHGSHASPSYFFPLAKKLRDSRISNVYTADINPSDDEPVPTRPLAQRIKQITRTYLEKGYGSVEYALIGHSLGALVAAKYIWRESQAAKAKVSMMISIAGRLKYFANKFAWFCEAVKPDINITYKAMMNAPHKSAVYTIWGDQDGIVPKESAHFQNAADRQYTVKGAGHGGIVLHTDAIRQTVVWTKKWVRA